MVHAVASSGGRHRAGRGRPLRQPALRESVARRRPGKKHLPHLHTRPGSGQPVGALVRHARGPDAEALDHRRDGRSDDGTGLGAVDGPAAGGANLQWGGFGGRVTLTASNAATGDVVQIYPSPGTNDFPSSGTYPWDYGFLPAGAWTITARAGAQTRTATLNIDASPVLNITEPDVTGGRDFATTTFGDAWDLTNPQDVFRHGQLYQIARRGVHRARSRRRDQRERQLRDAGRSQRDEDPGAELSPAHLHDPVRSSRVHGLERVESRSGQRAQRRQRDAPGVESLRRQRRRLPRLAGHLRAGRLPADLFGRSQDARRHEHGSRAGAERPVVEATRRRWVSSASTCTKRPRSARSASPR